MRKLVDRTDLGSVAEMREDSSSSSPTIYHKSVWFNSIRRGAKVLYAQEAWRRDLRNSCPWSFLQLYAPVAQRIRACDYES